MNQKLYLSTTSTLKLQHYQDHFGKLGFEIEALPLDIPEIQVIEPDKVALAKLAMAKKLTPLRPLLVDDVGLEIPALLGFPGAFLKPILELGGLRLLREMTGTNLKNESVQAQLVCAIAVVTSNREDENPILRMGRMAGTLNFTNKSYLDDQQTIRCFYPKGYQQSIAELQVSDCAIGYQHRFNALAEIATAIQHQN